MHKSKIHLIDAHFYQRTNSVETLFRSTCQGEFVNQAVGDVLRVICIKLQVFSRIVGLAYLLDGLQVVVVKIGWHSVYQSDSDTRPHVTPGLRFIRNAGGNTHNYLNILSRATELFEFGQSGLYVSGLYSRIQNQTVSDLRSRSEQFWS